MLYYLQPTNWTGVYHWIWLADVVMNHLRTEFWLSKMWTQHIFRRVLTRDRGQDYALVLQRLPGFSFGGCFVHGETEDQTPRIFGGTIFRQSHIFLDGFPVWWWRCCAPGIFPHGTSWHEMAMLDDLPPLLNMIKICCCHMRFPVLPSGNLT